MRSHTRVGRPQFLVVHDFVGKAVNVRASGQGLAPVQEAAAETAAAAAAAAARPALTIAVPATAPAGTPPPPSPKDPTARWGDDPAPAPDPVLDRPLPPAPPLAKAVETQSSASSQTLERCVCPRESLGRHRAPAEAWGTRTRLGSAAQTKNFFEKKYRTSSQSLVASATSQATVAPPPALAPALAPSTAGAIATGVGECTDAGTTACDGSPRGRGWRCRRRAPAEPVEQHVPVLSRCRVRSAPLAQPNAATQARRARASPRPFQCVCDGAPWLTARQSADACARNERGGGVEVSTWGRLMGQKAGTERRASGPVVREPSASLVHDSRCTRPDSLCWSSDCACRAGVRRTAAARAAGRRRAPAQLRLDRDRGC
jgi:hypothetical protein